MKQRRDRVWVVVLGVTLGNIGYQTAIAISALIQAPGVLWFWFMLVADLIATLGILYLLRLYVLGRRKDKANGLFDKLSDIRRCFLCGQTIPARDMLLLADYAQHQNMLESKRNVKRLQELAGGKLGAMTKSVCFACFLTRIVRSKDG